MKQTKTLTIFILLLATAYAHTTEPRQSLAAYNPIPYLRSVSYEDGLPVALGSYAIGGTAVLLIDSTKTSTPALFFAVALLIGNMKWGTAVVNQCCQQAGLISTIKKP